MKGFASRFWHFDKAVIRCAHKRDTFLMTARRPGRGVSGR